MDGVGVNACVQVATLPLQKAHQLLMVKVRAVAAVVAARLVLEQTTKGDEEARIQEIIVHHLVIHQRI